MTKPINNFPNYSITVDGTVINTKTKQVKKAWLGKNGYYHVDLYHTNKSTKVAIHRLLAMHFIPNPDNKRTVNHIDGCKTNNCLTNLEWSTDSENIQHAYDNNLNHQPKKISTSDLEQIFSRFLQGENLTTIVKDYSFSLPTVSTYIEDYVKSIGKLEEFNAEKIKQKQLRSKNSNRETYAITATNVTNPLDVRQFISLSEAARQLDKSSSGPISNALSGRAKSAYGFYWVKS